jgi:hypothetical protein
VIVIEPRGGGAESYKQIRLIVIVTRKPELEYATNAHTLTLPVSSTPRGSLSQQLQIHLYV